MEQQELLNMRNKQLLTLAANKDLLEELLGKVYGHKFSLEHGFRTRSSRSPESLLHRWIEFSQPWVMSGTQLGLLGEAIVRVNLDIQLSPTYSDTNGMWWWGPISLRWEHPDGGTNGQTIGQVWFWPEKYQQMGTAIKTDKGQFVIERSSRNIK